MDDDSKEKERVELKAKISALESLRKKLDNAELDKLGLKGLEPLRQEIKTTVEQAKVTYKVMDTENTYLECYMQGNFDEVRCKDEECSNFDKCLDDFKHSLYEKKKCKCGGKYKSGGEGWPSRMVCEKCGDTYDLPG